MPVIKQVFDGGCSYQVVQKVKVIDNTYMELVMRVGQVGWEVVDLASDENFMFVVWDRGDVNFSGAADGLYCRTRFEKIDVCERKQTSPVNCVCHYPQVKNVWCGIGPAAEEIKVCGNCNKVVNC
jgi:hypothetical protein